MDVVSVRLCLQYHSYSELLLREPQDESAHKEGVISELNSCTLYPQSNTASTLASPGPTIASTIAGLSNSFAVAVDQRPQARLPYR